MGNRACSSLCYSGDHSDAVRDDIAVTKLTTSNAKLWAIKQQVPPLDIKDEDSGEGSVDSYNYKMLTQHESTNRFAGEPRYEMSDGAAAGTHQQPSSALPDVPPHNRSFGGRSLSSDTNGREARTENVNLGRRASMAGEREEIQDEISLSRGDC